MANRWKEFVQYSVIDRMNDRGSFFGVVNPVGYTPDEVWEDLDKEYFEVEQEVLSDPNTLDNYLKQL